MSENRPVVLVVEDDIELNELEREFLAASGLDAVPAYSGLEALALYKRRTVDAVLLDIMLPELDGFETCRRLRRCNHVRVPIIMITALDSDETRRRGYDAGADAYFAKPFNPEELVATIRLLVEQVGHRGEPEAE